MRPKGNYDKLERRRSTAIFLQQKGLSVPRISKRMKVDRSSVYRWTKLYKEKGWQGLVPKEIPGRLGKLNRMQENQLSFILKKKSDDYVINTISLKLIPMSMNISFPIIQLSYNRESFFMFRLK